MKRLGMRKFIRLAREERGSALVEFAMTALIFMAIIVGMLEFALAVYTYHFVSSAAQQGARFALVRGQTWSTNVTTSCSTSAPPNFTMVYNCTASGTDIQNYVQSLATGGINASSISVDTTSADLWPGVNPDGGACSPTSQSQGCMVKVKVSYTFNFFKNVYPLQKLPGLSMTATSAGVILQ